MSSTPAPPPDWYPDPADPSRQRWWSGQGWTDHRREVPPPAFTAPAVSAAPVPPAAAATVNGYVPFGGRATSGMQTYAANPAPGRPMGSPTTIPIWLLALSPLIFSAALMLSIATSIPSAGLAIGLGIGGFLFLIVLIYWDSALLTRRNLPTPSALWLLLGLAGVVLGLLAYLIARSAALSAVGIRSFAPTISFGASLAGILVLASVVPILMR